MRHFASALLTSLSLPAAVDQNAQQPLGWPEHLMHAKFYCAHACGALFWPRRCGIQQPVTVVQVEVGSMNDPDSLPGLAHFTEHMLFYASDKYPKEDEYSQWVSDHGGHTNAWTSAENTNYQFSVNWDHLESTLDRFAQVRHSS